MAILNDDGNILANCPGCEGGRSSFAWKLNGQEVGCIHRSWESKGGDYSVSAEEYRLFQCLGCGRGAFAHVSYTLQIRDRSCAGYPGISPDLKDFYPEAKSPMSLPLETPFHIRNEFEEGVRCLCVKSFRAAALMFRAALEKTLLAAGYRSGMLSKKIQNARIDGMITAPMETRAANVVKGLGDEAAHDEWRDYTEEEISLAQDYCWHVILAFYDDRSAVVNALRSKKRTPAEDRADISNNL